MTVVGTKSVLDLIDESDFNAVLNKIQNGTDVDVVISSTVADTANKVNLTLTQNDTTNNPNVVLITNTGTGNDIQIATNSAKITHSGTTSLTIASTNGTVVIESVTFTGGVITGASMSADQISAGALNIGANTFTVNSVEIVGSDGVVNAAAIEDAFLANNADDTTTGRLTADKGFAVTIANTVNQTGLTIVQNDTTNNPIGLSITNAGTGNSLFLDTDGNAVSLNIDSEATSASIIVISADNTSATTGLIDIGFSTTTLVGAVTGIDLNLSTNVTHGSQVIKGLNITLPASDQTTSYGLQVTSSATAPLIYVDANGNTGALNGAIHVENTGNINEGLVVTSGQTSAQTRALVKFLATDTTFDQAVFEIQQNGTSQAINLLLDGTGKMIDFDCLNGKVSGTILEIDWSQATTLTGAIIAFDVDLSTNVTASNVSISGFDMILNPAVTNTTAAGSSTYKNEITGGALTTSPASGTTTTNWYGYNIELPNATATAGATETAINNVYGLRLIGPTTVTASGGGGTETNDIALIKADTQGNGVVIDWSGMANTEAVFQISDDDTDPTGGGGAATGRVPVLDTAGNTHYFAYY